jgi:hypothetical protein
LCCCALLSGTQIFFRYGLGYVRAPRLYYVIHTIGDRFKSCSRK